ncbi:MAG TPA: hypothetical protein PKB15_02120 [Acidimicrobiia bacterium]|nr:hypothetical protein [Acidimicrobiia bacterium]
MNDNTFSEDPEIDETFHQELRDDMKRLATNNAQPTTHAWEAIMEESTTHHRRISRRTQLVSAAAAAAVIIAITGGVLVVANNGGTKEGIKTVDKKKKDPVATSTTTTAPLTNEQELLKDTYLVRATVATVPPEIDGAASYEVVTAMDVLDGTSNQVLYSLPNDAGPDGSGFPVNLNIKRVSGPEIAVNRYTQCDVPFGFSTVNLTSGTSTYTGYIERLYSPSGKKYIELDPSCDTPESIFVVDAKTNKKRELKPETISGNPTWISDVIWIDDNRFVYSTRHQNIAPTTTEIKPRYFIADLTKNVSIAKDLHLQGFDKSEILDIIQSKGKTYALVLTSTAGLVDNGPNTTITSQTMEAVDINSRDILWSHELSSDDPLYSGPLVFANSPTRIVGSINNVAYLYDQPTNTTLRPGGVAVLPKR